MKDPAIAKRIGFVQAFKAISIGLILAYLIMASLSGADWLFNFSYSGTIFFSILCIYGVGFLFGRLIGKWINKGRPAIFLGILGGFLIVWSATFLGSLGGFLFEGLDTSLGNRFNDYIIKPLFWVTIFGFLPVIIVGIWFGLSVKRKLQK